AYPSEETCPVKRPVRFLGVVAVFGLMSASPAPAQEDPDFFKKPETPAEFWRALNFELNVGKFELAAAFLKGFLNSNPTEQDYLDIIEGRSRTGEGEYQGMAPFLRLRT